MFSNHPTLAQALEKPASDTPDSKRNNSSSFENVGAGTHPIWTWLGCCGGVTPAINKRRKEQGEGSLDTCMTSNKGGR